jgi:hypothetical protein
VRESLRRGSGRGRLTSHLYLSAAVADRGRRRSPADAFRDQKCGEARPHPLRSHRVREIHPFPKRATAAGRALHITRRKREPHYTALRVVREDLSPRGAYESHVAGEWRYLLCIVVVDTTFLSVGFSSSLSGLCVATVSVFFWVSLFSWGAAPSRSCTCRSCFS